MLLACSHDALPPLSRSASELTRAQGRTQEVLPGHSETLECYLGTLMGQKDYWDWMLTVSLQESNNKRQRLNNNNVLRFHNHQFATKTRSNTWTGKYVNYHFGTWSQMNAPGFPWKLLLHDEYYERKCDLLVKSQEKDSPRPLSSTHSHSEKLSGAVKAMLIWQHGKSYHKKCGISIPLETRLPHLTKAHDNTDMDI